MCFIWLRGILANVVGARLQRKKNFFQLDEVRRALQPLKEKCRKFVSYEIPLLSNNLICLRFWEQEKLWMYT